MITIDYALSFDDVLLVPRKSDLSSRSDVDLSTNLTRKIKINFPLVSSAMYNVTESEMAIAMAKEGGLGIIHRFMTIEEECEHVKRVKECEFEKKGFPLASVDKKGRLLVGASIGVKNDFIKRTEALLNAGCDIITIDVAHGHMEKVIKAIKQIKREFEDVNLIAGNVATYEAAKDLAEAGADCIKVGIGPGSTCITRIVTGFGVPLFTSLIECSKILKEYDVTLMADGGMRSSGDIVKALAAGASIAMCGFIFSGTDEAPGEIIEVNGKKFKQFNGMFSLHANKKLKSIENENLENNRVITEGVEAFVPYKGRLSDVFFKIAGGIRHGLSYCGARNIQELQEKAKFIKITQNGLRESYPHDVAFLENQ